MTLLNYLLIITALTLTYLKLQVIFFSIFVVLRTLMKISIKWFSMPCGLVRSRQCKYLNWNVEYRYICLC